MNGQDEEGDPTQWPVFEECRIEHGNLVVEGPVAKWYNPLEYDQLVAAFSDLKDGDEDGLLDFARTWGDLRTEAFSSGAIADPVPLVWGHARNVRLVLHLQHYLQSGDLEGLEQFLSAHFGPRPRAADQEQKLFPEFFPFTVVLLESPFKEEVQLTWREPRGIAEDIISSVLNANLVRVHYRVEGGDGESLRLINYCPSLLASIYWLLAEIVTGGRRLKSCEECRKLFVVPDGRQKYCPEPPFQIGTTGSLCGARKRKRLQRDKDKREETS